MSLKDAVPLSVLQWCSHFSDHFWYIRKVTMRQGHSSDTRGRAELTSGKVEGGRMPKARRHNGMQSTASVASSLLQCTPQRPCCASWHCTTTSLQIDWSVHLPAPLGYSRLIIMAGLAVYNHIVFSRSNLGVCQIRIENESKAIWIRHAHLCIAWALTQEHGCQGAVE